MPQPIDPLVFLAGLAVVLALYWLLGDDDDRWPPGWA